MAGAAGVVAAAGAAVIGMTPTLASSPQLLGDSSVYYLPGTKIGDVRTDPESQDFVAAMLQGSKNQTVDPATVKIIDYPGGFWPVSTGGLNDPTYNQSVADGLAALSGRPVSGDTIVGFSQGAVVATEYKREHPNSGVNYVLIENPNRPNGGILERFNGLHIPILDISFNGSTPTDGDPTVDISRQYDGWSDFPTYPLNLLATVNALAGIYYLHGNTQDLGSTDVSSIDKTNSMYYQQHGTTTYYLIPTDQLPILMPFNGIVPDPVLKALDPPLRALVELGYDRSDYGKPTPARAAPIVNPTTVAQAVGNATGQGVQAALADAGASTASTVNPSVTRDAIAGPEHSAKMPDVSKVLPTPDVLKPITPKSPRLPKLPSVTASPLSSTIGIKAPSVESKGTDGPQRAAKTAQSVRQAQSPKHLAPHKAKGTADHAPAN